MFHLKTIALACLGALLIFVLVREIVSRILIRYEYRFDSFSIQGLFGRQLFQIRQSEIESLAPARFGQDLAGSRRWARSQFGRRIVIRARLVRKPIVITWEGEPIAGLTPEGMKLRRGKAAKPR
jgi:hypothetical protein